MAKRLSRKERRELVRKFHQATKIRPQVVGTRVVIPVKSAMTLLAAVALLSTERDVLRRRNKRMKRQLRGGRGRVEKRGKRRVVKDADDSEE